MAALERVHVDDLHAVQVTREDGFVLRKLEQCLARHFAHEQCVQGILFACPKGMRSGRTREELLARNSSADVPPAFEQILPTLDRKGEKPEVHVALAP